MVVGETAFDRVVCKGHTYISNSHYRILQKFNSQNNNSNIPSKLVLRCSHHIGQPQTNPHKVITILPKCKTKTNEKLSYLFKSVKNISIYNLVFRLLFTSLRWVLSKALQSEIVYSILNL